MTSSLIFQRESGFSVTNRATCGTNSRPIPAATRNHSHTRTARNNRNKTPALDERLWSGPGGGPRAALRLMSVGVSERPFPASLQSLAR
jgi:hypothetical protein